MFAELQANDTEVFGISSDSVESHAAFRAKEDLPFRLLSDPDGEVRRRYGVPDDLFGLIPGRATFVIAADGRVREVYQSQFDFDGHATAACAAVAESRTEAPPADARNRTPDSR